MRTERIVLVATAILALAVASHAQVADRADVQLQAAIKQELVEGDLQGAIKQYQAIASTYRQSNRAVAAKALLHEA
jgi:outer membrane protein assembly factor BamD (BamD/ComL family)